MDQYLYRLFGADGTLLYTGVSDDWTRRLRQHWQTKQWAVEILRVTLEIYPDRVAVLAAERKAIKAEKPQFNIQHNHRHSPPVPEAPASPITITDILIITALVVAAGFIIYELSQAAIEKYRAWKADREEFREWQHARTAGENQPGQDDNCDSAEVTVVVAALTPIPQP